MLKFDQSWSAYAKVYDPIQVGSIDGTHTDPHDNGIVRACNASYHPNRLLKNDPERTLFIGRLDRDVMEKDLENLFSKYGTLENVTVVRDIVTGFSKRYAFVEFRSRRDCHLARSKEQKTILKGKEILVEFECQNTLPGWIPRRLGKVEALVVKKNLGSYVLVVLTDHGKGPFKLCHILVECPSPTQSSVMLNPIEIHCVCPPEFQLMPKVEGKSILRYILKEPRSLVRRQEA
ncbi:hypothetical protein GHT06_015021 [Daphnia sinensis]|uniref:RRM domain-containing protein n=1 Tax=Daphnia sinensis TaxID=1820382 RepID=A0AAD5PUC3_9CRUS|nr:hypothetical protein GHT06_015021 [Daphnia sinensis]